MVTKLKKRRVKLKAHWARLNAKCESAKEMEKNEQMADGNRTVEDRRFGVYNWELHCKGGVRSV